MESHFTLARCHCLSVLVSHASTVMDESCRGLTEHRVYARFVCMRVHCQGVV